MHPDRLRWWHQTGLRWHQTGLRYRAQVAPNRAQMAPNRAQNGTKQGSDGMIFFAACKGFQQGARSYYLSPFECLFCIYMCFRALLAPNRAQPFPYLILCYLIHVSGHFWLSVPGSVCLSQCAWLSVPSSVCPCTSTSTHCVSGLVGG